MNQPTLKRLAQSQARDLPILSQRWSAPLHCTPSDETVDSARAVGGMIVTIEVVHEHPVSHRSCRTRP